METVASPWLAASRAGEEATRQTHMNKEGFTQMALAPCSLEDNTMCPELEASTCLANLVERAENKPRNCRAAAPRGRGDGAASIQSVMTTGDPPIPPPRAAAPPERYKSTIYTEDPRVDGWVGSVILPILQTSN